VGGPSSGFSGDERVRLIRIEERTMKAGAVYPQIELCGDTGAIKAFAQAAEDLGYDHIVIYDHVLSAIHAGRETQLTESIRISGVSSDGQAERQ
jgi:hypothetical protein